jgi:hypothetical protein
MPFPSNTSLYPVPTYLLGAKCHFFSNKLCY